MIKSDPKKVTWFKGLVIFGQHDNARSYTTICVPALSGHWLFTLTHIPKHKPEPGGTSLLDKHGSKQPLIKAINFEQIAMGWNRGLKQTARGLVRPVTLF